MPRYVNGINVSSVSLGQNTGAALTTGTRNVLLGPEAGSSLTTGSNNVVLGSYTCSGEPAVQGNVVLSNGSGTVVCRWDANGAMTPTVPPVANVNPPSQNGTLSMAWDESKAAVVFQQRVDAAHPNVVSYSASKASVDALGIDAASLGGYGVTDLMLRADTYLTSSGTGQSLIANAEELRLRGLDVKADGGLELDTANPNVIQLSAQPTTLSDETTAPSAHSVVGGTSAGRSLKTKGIVAGAGINISSTSSTITIENTQTSAGVTLLSAGTGTGVCNLVTDGQGPELIVRGLRPETGITLTEDDVTHTVTIGSSLQSVAPQGAESVFVSPASIKGIRAGYHVGLVSGTGAITVRCESPVTVDVRPRDVVATSGQCRVETTGAPSINLSSWPSMSAVADADLLTGLTLPSIRYLASGAGVVSHRGSLVATVHGLPTDAAAVLGLRLHVTALLSAGHPGAVLTCALSFPTGTGTQPWSASTIQGTLTLAAAAASANTLSLVEVSGLTGSSMVTCVDTVSRPCLPTFAGGMPCPTVVLVSFSSASQVLPQDLHILGLRLSLIPQQ